METEKAYKKSVSYLKTLCEDIKDRSVGSAGNRQATDFFNKEISSFGWNCETSELNVVDWEDRGATLQAEDISFKVSVSPYSLGCNVKEELTSISNIEEIERTDKSGKIVLLYGEIAREQLMPKNFVFFNPEEHQRIIALLEEKKPAAIVSATGRNAALAGGVYPFPLIEDGDFDIPSVYMTEEEGRRLLPHTGKSVQLKSHSRRIPAKASNVIARKGKNATERIVITAHIDAKKGTPGAIDNATGIMVLLLVAEMLEDYDGDRMLELVALNGEDYYAVPGQMDYIYNNQNKFNEILLNINIDGAGYKAGKSTFSLFNLSEKMQKKVNDIFTEYNGITEGIQWSQGDHSIFVQQGCPAIAVSSKWFIDNMDSQTITHTPKDNAGIVDCRKVVEIAEALNWLIRR
ncbi:M28 family peptidase [candidate division KSB1 bacterium]|nr:M28 family peptidase [candidate division KSB1 bacterium]